MKTIKEQIEEKAREYLDPAMMSTMDEKALRSYLKMTIDAIKSGVSLAQRWIDVSERLPAPNKEQCQILIREIGKPNSVKVWNIRDEVDLNIIRGLQEPIEWRPIDITIE